MSQRTDLQKQLSDAANRIGTYEMVDPYYLTILLKSIEFRLYDLEKGLLKMDAAIKADPVAGYELVQSIIQSLLQSRY